METTCDFGELSQDEGLQKRIRDFEGNLRRIEAFLKTFSTSISYNELSLEDKVRTQGVDPNEHDIKSELNRIKMYMAKSKKIYEKQNIMPRIDQEAANRFIRSGLWTPNQSSINSFCKNYEQKATVSKKRKRESDDDGEESSCSK